MRPVVLVYEHVTAAGVHDAPPALNAAGLAMADALLGDLCADGRCTIRVVRDARLPLPFAGLDVRSTNSARDADEALESACRGASLAWLIAPETDGVLEALTRRVAALGTPVAGASAEAVAIASSKRRTAQRLAGAGVPVVPTYRPDAFAAGGKWQDEWAEAVAVAGSEWSGPDRLASAGGPVATIDGPDARAMGGKWQGEWVVKPDDGAGCESTWVVHSRASALRLIASRRIANPVVQPYLQGEALSISCLATREDVVVLGVNRQHVVRAGERLHFEGVTPDARAGEGWDPDALVHAVVQALPGLRGYFGIDLLLHDRQPVIVEVNPRLTTSYAHLGAALGWKIATRILNDFGLPEDEGTEPSRAC